MPLKKTSAKAVAAVMAPVATKHVASRAMAVVKDAQKVDVHAVGMTRVTAQEAVVAAAVPVADAVDAVIAQRKANANALTRKAVRWPRRRDKMSSKPP